MDTIQIKNTLVLYLYRLFQNLIHYGILIFDEISRCTYFVIQILKYLKKLI